MASIIDFFNTPQVNGYRGIYKKEMGIPKSDGNSSRQDIV